jgi:hypothetical protein
MRWLRGGLAAFAASIAIGVSCGGKEPAPAVPEGPWRAEASGEGGPVEWKVTGEVDKKEVQVGEDLNLTLTLSHPADGNYVPPAGSAFAPFDVIGMNEEKVSPVETKLHYRLAAYRLPEELQIPALEIRYREGDESKTLSTEPIPVKLVTSLSPDIADIHDIKGPIDLLVPRDWRLFLWLLLALLAAVLAYLIYRKLRKEPQEAAALAPSVPLLPPDEEALRALERLREKKLVEEGEVRLFYTELAEIVKRYVGRRFDVPYLERTTSEVLSDLKPRRAEARGEGGPRKLATDRLSELRAILEASDLVKFAKLMPEATEAERAFRMAEEWVEKTRPAPATERSAATLGATA